MDTAFIKKMNEKYHEYAKSTEKMDLNKRLIENEKWFRKKQDEIRTSTNAGENKRIPSVKGGYLFNAIINKHADAMDNYPDISILPREEKDKDLADTLTGVIPYILDRSNFEKVYSDNWYSKLKTSSCYSVTWDEDENNGKGDIKIGKTELLNLFWQPNIADIQQSEFIFYHSYLPKKAFVDLYGLDKLEKSESVTEIDTYESLKFELKNEFILIVDCYYKKVENGKTKLHFAKFSGEQLLFSSEDAKNDDGSVSFPNGYYDHGKYPFVFDIMYPCEQSIAGFGVADALKDIQSYIDATDELLQINNRIVGKPRLIYSKSLGVNVNDLVDLNKDFIEVEGSVDPNSFYKIPTESLPAQVVNSLQQKKDELKEIIGNRDFQQGGTSGGVTSGSAISILQSAGDKLSRDLIKSSYRAYKEIILLCIELIRQFYDEERTVRITGKDGNDEFVRFSNEGMKNNPLSLPHSQFSYNDKRDVEDAVPYNMGITENPLVDLGATEGAPVGFGGNLSAYPDGASTIPTSEHDNSNIPLFDVKLAVQKSNPYSRELNNQTIITLADKGLLNPQNFDLNLPVLNALQFDGKDALIKELRETSEAMNQREAEAAMKQQMLSAGQIPNINGPSRTPSPTLNEEAGNDASYSADDDDLIDITNLMNGG